MKISIIIQARVGSTRLPKKVLLPLGDKTILERVIERASKSRLASEVIVATTKKRQDHKIISLCQKIGIDFFRGSEDDVLDRYYQSALSRNSNNIIRITADCPLIDFRIIDKVIDKHLREKNDYTGNTVIDSFPDGQDVEIFTFDALKKAWKEANLLSDREHVTQYIKRNPNLFSIGSLVNERDLSKMRWTIDNPEDYDFLTKVFIKVHQKNLDFSMQEIVDFLSDNEELLKINAHIGHNEGLVKSLREDRIIKRTKGNRIC